MKIGVLGIGAVGGFYGSKLAQAGVDVTFIGREKTVEQIKSNGLTINSYKGNYKLNDVKVFHDFKHVRDVDYLLLCVKSYNTREIVESLKKRISEKTIIVSMQNGVDNEEILAEVFGKDRVIGAVLYITVNSPSPSIINHTGFGKVVFGEIDGTITDRVTNLQKLFIDSGVPSGVTSDIKKELWKKLMLNNAYNGITSLISRTLEKFDDIPEAKECFFQILKEVQLVAQKEGFNITDEEVEETMKLTHSKAFITFKTSTLQDAEAGKPLEIDSLQGVILKAAKKHDVDIPMNKLLYSLLKLKY